MKKTASIVFVLVAVIVSCSADSNNSIWGNYAGLSGYHDLDYFKERYEEMKKDGSLPKDIWGNYAGLSGYHDLDYFKERYEEIKRDGFPQK